MHIPTLLTLVSDLRTATSECKVYSNVARILFERAARLVSLLQSDDEMASRVGNEAIAGLEETLRSAIDVLRLHGDAWLATLMWYGDSTSLIFEVAERLEAICQFVIRSIVPPSAIPPGETLMELLEDAAIKDGKALAAMLQNECNGVAFVGSLRDFLDRGRDPPEFAPLPSAPPLSTTSSVTRSTKGADVVTGVAMPPPLDVSELKVTPRRLAQGEFGFCYPGKYRGQDVVVKFVTKMVDLADFMREIAIGSRLCHPNIVKVFGGGMGCPWPDLKESLGAVGYGVLDLMQGGTLSDMLVGPNAKKCSFTLRISWAVDIARAIAYLHHSPRPIVHRDVKSDNVLLDAAQQKASLTDFGVAVVRMGTRSVVTSAGTPGWKAPEVARGESDRPSADVYSFGVLLWQLFSSFRSEFVPPLNDMLSQASSLDIGDSVPPGTAKALTQMIRQCCSERSEGRPHVAHVLTDLCRIASSCGVNVGQSSAATVMIAAEGDCAPPAEPAEWLADNASPIRCIVCRRSYSSFKVGRAIQGIHHCRLCGNVAHTRCCEMMAIPPGVPLAQRPGGGPETTSEKRICQLCYGIVMRYRDPDPYFPHASAVAVCGLGCRQIMLRVRYQDHLSSCPMAPVSCECGVTIDHQKDLPTHVDRDCPLAHETCRKCGTMTIRREIRDGTHAAVCPKRLVPCSRAALGCRVRVPFDTLEKHVECDCVFRDVTCQCKAVMQARRMADHRDQRCPEHPVPCPHCRRTEPRKHIGECPRRPVDCGHEGCRERIAAQDRPSHRSACPHAPWCCSACNGHFKLMHKDSHLQTCPEYASPCKHCGEVLKQKLHASHYDRCDLFPLPCQQCGDPVGRILIESHKRDACPETPFECRMKAHMVRRADRASHDLFCDAVEEPCQYCTRNVARKNMRHHCTRECDMRPTKCSQCNHNVPLSRLQSHKEQECLRRLVDCDQKRHRVYEYKRVGHNADCDAVVVSCEHKCRFRAERGKIGEHEEQCDLKPVGCPLDSRCGHHITLGVLEEHMRSVCQYRPAKCRCGAEMLFKDLASHVKNECAVEPVPCSHENCGVRPLRCKRRKHEEECCWKPTHCRVHADCPVVKPLIYLDIHERGCEWRWDTCEYCNTHVRVRDMKRHVERCDFAPVHCTHCHATMQQRKRSDHESICTYRPEPCRYQSRGCQLSPQQRKKQEHEAECDFRPQACPLFCGLQGATGPQLRAHECPDAVVSCPNRCGYQCKRRLMDAHTESKCERRPKVPCPNGCGANVFQDESAVVGHRATCPNERISCPIARYRCPGLQRKDENTHRAVCDYAEDSCVYCRQSMERRSLPDHKRECDKRPWECDECFETMPYSEKARHKRGLCQTCADHFCENSLRSHVQSCRQRREQEYAKAVDDRIDTIRREMHDYTSELPAPATQTLAIEWRSPSPFYNTNLRRVDRATVLLAVARDECVVSDLPDEDCRCDCVNTLIRRWRRDDFGHAAVPVILVFLGGDILYVGCDDHSRYCAEAEGYVIFPASGAPRIIW